MPTFKYDKLVRDKIAKWHEEAGHSVELKKLNDEELLRALCDKLHEEADEVGSASDTEDLIEEIADVQQILDDICAQKGISKSDIENARKAKENKKGGFKNGVYIDSVTMPEDDEWVEYCRKDPVKYPEVSEC